MVTLGERLCKVKTGPLGPSLLLLLVTMIWGASFIVVKEALSFTGPFTFLFWRCLVALPLFLVWRTRSQIRGLNGSSLRAGVLTGLTLAGGFLFQTFAMRFTTATNAAIFTGAYVVLVPVLAILLLKERLKPAHVAGVILCACGSVWLTRNATAFVGPGDALILVGAFFFALQIIAVQKWTPKMSPALIATLQNVVLLALSLVCALVWERPLAVPVSAAFWFRVGFTAALPTFACFLLQATMQRRTTATVAAIIYSLEPGFGALFAHWVGGEALTGATLVALAMFVAGMVVAQHPLFVRGLGVRERRD